jgi:hypothetical protein
MTTKTVTHTPGPWHVAGGTDERFVDSGTNGTVAKIAIKPEMSANARLIAAAPQLLEALETLLDISPFARDATGADMHERARAVIRSAKGEL